MTVKINLYVIQVKGKRMKVIVPSGLIISYGKDYFTLAITSS